MDRTPWEAAVGGMVGAAVSMAIAWSAFWFRADRLDVPGDEAEAVGRLLLRVLILGYALFAAGVAGTLLGSTLFLARARRGRIMSTLGLLIALELVAVPIGVAVTLFSQDHALGDLLFVLSVALITAVAPFAARVIAIRDR